MPLSTKQMEYLALAWQCFEAEPKIDYEKFHQLAGLSTAASARELMRVTKKKLKEEYGAMGASVAGPNAKTSPSKTSPSKKNTATLASTPKSGTKRGRPAKSIGEDEDQDDEVEHTPAKRTKSISVKKAAAGKENRRIKSEPIADSEDEDILT